MLQNETKQLNGGVTTVYIYILHFSQTVIYIELRSNVGQIGLVQIK